MDKIPYGEYQQRVTDEWYEEMFRNVNVLYPFSVREESIETEKAE